MKAALLLVLPLAVGCAAPAPARCPEPPAVPEHHEPDHHEPDHHEAEHREPDHHEDHGPHDAKVAPSGAGARDFAVTAATSDAPIHPEVLHEDAEVKIAVVTIQPGATMPEHATPVPVTVQTVSGAGVMTVAGKEHGLAAGKLHLLDAGAPHALVASGDAPLVVLVHYLKREGVQDHHAH